MAKLLDQVKNAGLNSGGTLIGKLVRLDRIKKHPELESIFSIDDGLLADIAESMTKYGFDKAQPVVIWKGEDYLVDGYTRYKAAELAGLSEIPADEKEFTDLQEAVRYCYRRQAERRNLSSAEILEASRRLGFSKKELAKNLGVSESTVSRAKKIEREGSDEDKNAIRENRETINSVYTKIKKPKPQKGEPPDLSAHTAAISDAVCEVDIPDPGLPDEAGEEKPPELWEGDILDGAVVEPETAGNDEYEQPDGDHELFTRRTQIMRKLVSALIDHQEKTLAAEVLAGYSGTYNREAVYALLPDGYAE